MQLFTTDLGIERRIDGDRLELVETPHTSVWTALTAGAIDDVMVAPGAATRPIIEARFETPVRPTRLFQVGLNYLTHIEEIGLAVPERPMWAVTEVGEALAGPEDQIRLPPEAPEAVDHECEIAVVVGRRARRVAVGDAWDVIAGVTACNDVSARDLQRAGLAKGELTAGKLLPGFKPFGPGLLTADEASAGPLRLRLSVNGEVRQDSDSDDMIFSIPEIIELLTADQELEPGDVIITGSPAGVGFFNERFLGDGDVVEVHLADLPPLRNTFTA